MDNCHTTLLILWSATPVKNLYISSLGLDTKDGEYLDKEYSSTLILNWLGYISFSTFTSLFPRRIYIPKKVSLNSSYSIWTESIGLLYFYLVYLTLATSLNLYEANSAFSVDFTPVSLNTL